MSRSSKEFKDFDSHISSSTSYASLCKHKWSASELYAIVAWVCGVPVLHIAKRLGVIEATIHNWKRKKEWKEDAESIRESIFEDIKNDATFLVGLMMKEAKLGIRDYPKLASTITKNRELVAKILGLLVEKHELSGDWRKGVILTSIQDLIESAKEIEAQVEDE